jgi:hypothetical protein
MDGTFIIGGRISSPSIVKKGGDDGNEDPPDLFM